MERKLELLPCWYNLRSPANPEWREGSVVHVRGLHASVFVIIDRLTGMLVERPFEAVTFGDPERIDMKQHFERLMSVGGNYYYETGFPGFDFERAETANEQDPSVQPAS